MPATCHFCHNTISFGPVFCSRTHAPAIAQGNCAFIKVSSEADSLEHVAGLSLFSVEHGLINFSIEGKSYVLSPGTYLMLNKGQRYQASWKAGYEAELLCVQFDENLAARTLGSLQRQAGSLIQPDKLPVQFFNQADKPAPAVQQLLTLLRQHITRASTAINPESLFSSLLEHLCHMQQQVQATIDLLGPVKSSTRTELYNRLRTSRNFIDTHLHRNLNLDEVASEACLSKFHFMRLFKQAFGQTVHQYITTQRLNRTRLLLELEEKPFSEICRSMGYEDVAWFAKVYKRAFGLPPSRYTGSLLQPAMVAKRAVA